MPGGLSGSRRGVGPAGAGEPVPQDNNFTVTGAKSVGVDVSAAGLMDICLAENDRRLGGYDARLLRPTTMPRLVRFARRFMANPAAAA